MWHVQVFQNLLGHALKRRRRNLPALMRPDRRIGWWIRQWFKSDPVAYFETKILLQSVPVKPLDAWPAVLKHPKNLELVPRVARFSAVAFDRFPHRFGAPIVEELLAVAKSHQQFGPEFRRVGLLQADVGKLGPHVMQQEVRI